MPQYEMLKYRAGPSLHPTGGAAFGVQWKNLMPSLSRAWNGEMYNEDLRANRKVYEREALQLTGMDENEPAPGLSLQGVLYSLTSSLAAFESNIQQKTQELQANITQNMLTNPIDLSSFSVDWNKLVAIANPFLIGPRNVGLSDQDTQQMNQLIEEKLLSGLVGFRAAVIGSRYQTTVITNYEVLSSTDPTKNIIKMIEANNYMPVPFGRQRNLPPGVQPVAAAAAAPVMPQMGPGGDELPIPQLGFTREMTGVPGTNFPPAGPRVTPTDAPLADVPVNEARERNLQRAQMLLQSQAQNRELSRARLAQGQPPSSMTKVAIQQDKTRKKMMQEQQLEDVYEQYPPKPEEGQAKVQQGRSVLRRRDMADVGEQALPFTADAEGQTDIKTENLVRVANKAAQAATRATLVKAAQVEQKSARILTAWKVLMQKTQNQAKFKETRGLATKLNNALRASEQGRAQLKQQLATVEPENYRLGQVAIAERTKTLRAEQTVASQAEEIGKLSELLLTQSGISDTQSANATEMMRQLEQALEAVRVAENKSERLLSQNGELLRSQSSQIPLPSSASPPPQNPPEALAIAPSPVKRLAFQSSPMPKLSTPPGSAAVLRRPPGTELGEAPKLPTPPPAAQTGHSARSFISEVKAHNDAVWKAAPKTGFRGALLDFIGQQNRLGKRLNSGVTQTGNDMIKMLTDNDVKIPEDLFTPAGKLKATQFRLNMPEEEEGRARLRKVSISDDTRNWDEMNSGEQKIAMANWKARLRDAEADGNKQLIAKLRQEGEDRKFYEGKKTGKGRWTDYGGPDFSQSTARVYKNMSIGGAAQRRPRTVPAVPSYMDYHDEYNDTTNVGNGYSGGRSEMMNTECREAHLDQTWKGLPKRLGVEARYKKMRGVGLTKPKEFY